MPMSRHYRPIALLVMIALLLQPMLQAFALASVAPIWLHSYAVDTAKAQSADQVYLPIITKGGSSTPMPTATPTPTPSSTPVTPPGFIIMAPTAGSTVAGTINFAIQPLNAISITSVSFQVGSTQVGVDNTPSDGFRVFVNTKTLAAGNQQFTATATGPSGSATQSVTVNVVPNPPSAATIGNQGGVLATTRGSVISILPNSVPPGTAITVTEMTQQEVTNQNGIQWDQIGVTFLGQQNIQSSIPFSRPLGSVTSAGYGNRVQPGQAVVNYRIAPDMDGDGVDEIVVVNTASVAPNGDVVSDPVSKSMITGNFQASTDSRSFGNNFDEVIQGQVGTPLKLKVTGFNPASIYGNVGVWRSKIDNRILEIPALVYPSTNDELVLSTIIPPLPVGGARVAFINKSTGISTEPVDIVVQASHALTKPAYQIIDKYLTDTINYFLTWSTMQSQESQVISTTIKGLTQIQVNLKETVTEGLTNQDIQLLNELAQILEHSEVYDTNTAVIAASNGYSSQAAMSDVISLGASFFGTLTAAAGIVGATTLLGLYGNAGLFFFGIMGTAWFGCQLINDGNCSPPSLPLPPNICLFCITGTGSAPPPGGNGAGNVGGGGSGSRNLVSASQQQNSNIYS